MGGAGAGRLGASARKMLGCSPAAARCTVLRARRNSRREGRARARRHSGRVALRAGREAPEARGGADLRPERDTGVAAGGMDAPARPLPPDAAEAAGGVHSMLGAADATPRPSDAPCSVRGGGTPGDAWTAAAGAERAGSMSVGRRASQRDQDFRPECSERIVASHLASHARRGHAQTPHTHLMS